MDALEAFEYVKTGWETIRKTKAVKFVKRGLQTVIGLMFAGVRMIDGYFVMSGFMICFGVLQLLLLTASMNTGAANINTGDSQRVIILGAFIVIGWLIGYSRNIVLMFVGSLMTLWYSGILIQATIIGNVDLRGYLGGLYLIAMVLGLLVAAVTEYDKLIERKRFEEEAKVYREQIATFEATWEALRQGRTIHGINSEIAREQPSG